MLINERQINGINQLKADARAAEILSKSNSLSQIQRVVERNFSDLKITEEEVELKSGEKVILLSIKDRPEVEGVCLHVDDLTIGNITRKEGYLALVENYLMKEQGGDK